MNNLNTPIYRANILGSNKNITGWFLPEYYDCVNLIRYSNVIFINNIEFFEIDPTTLAIHFSDMLDSQGNKIFASLSEDGKGGDILYWHNMTDESDCSPSTAMFTNNRVECFEEYFCDLDIDTMIVIGIQK